MQSKNFPLLPLPIIDDSSTDSNDDSSGDSNDGSHKDDNGASAAMCKPRTSFYCFYLAILIKIYDF